MKIIIELNLADVKLLDKIYEFNIDRLNPFFPYRTCTPEEIISKALGHLYLSMNR